MKKSIIFFGNERLATGLTQVEPLVFHSLIDEGYDIDLVVTPFTPPRSRRQRPLEIAEAAATYKVPVVSPRSKAELREALSPHSRHIAVLVAFGMIVPADVINRFECGILNLHPSLLPELRGPTPIETAILEGRTESGISIMQLTAEMDAGPVLAQQAINLKGDETKPGLARALHELGAKLMLRQLEAAFAGSLNVKEQDATQATFSRLITKADGVIDWSKPATQLEREVRAYSGWPGSQATLMGRKVTVTHASVAEDSERKPGAIDYQSSRIVVQAGEGSLVIHRLIPEGRKEMSAADFVRGLKL